MNDFKAQKADIYDILIVDDTRDSLKLLNRILEEQGYRIRPATSGRLALKSVAAKLPDLILLDVKMPEMDGYEVCRRLKSDEQSRNIPIIFISAYSETTKKVEGFRAGGVDFITKPFEREEVLARVRIHLQLRELTEHLEKTVDKRTEELRAVNVRLKRELSQRKRTEAALKTSEDRYIDLYENASDMYMSVNARTAVIENCNRTLAEALGEPKEEIIGRSLFEIYHQDCRIPAKEAFEEFLEKGEARCKELQLRQKDGSKMEVILNMAPIRAEDGTVLFSRSTMRDNTEQRRNTMINETRIRLMQFAAAHSLDELLEETLNEAEKLTESRIGFYHFVDADQESLTLQNWSTRTKESFCKAQGKGLHYRISDAGVWVDCVRQRKTVVHNDYYSLPHRRGMPEGHAEVIRELVVPVIRKEKIRAILGVGNKPSDYSKKDVEVVTSLADLVWEITERKLAEESIRKLSHAVEQSPVSIVITDAGGMIEFVNHAFTQITGYAYGDVVGKNARILRSGIAPDGEYSGIWKIISSGGVWRGELHSRKKDGELFCEHTTIAPIRNDKNVTTHFVSFNEDISEQKKLEEQVLQSQKMEAIGQLAGGVAHDFNNMLNVIIGYTELAISLTDQSLPVFKYLEEIFKAAERSADLTRQLLAFARRQTIAPVVLDLNTTVKNMLKILQRLIGEDIELLWLPAPDLWPVRMDSSQLDQILTNLCVNARDAITNTGRVAIETRNSVVDEAYCRGHVEFVPGEYTELVVSDNGCGMDKTTQDKIFEPFFSTKAPGRGTGLGLATVYGIVRQNSGFINVYSEPGHGTTFKIYLPRHTVEAGQMQKEIPAAAPTRGHETVLLVEDDPALIEIIKTALAGFGYRVVTALRPDEAIRLAEEHSGDIRLLITDVIMPGMNGKELADTLTSLYPELNCLFMSGYTDNLIAQHGVLDEGVNFIQKPFSINALAVRVREVLDNGYV